MPKKQWEILNKDRDRPLLERLFINRGLVTPEEQDQFVNWQQHEFFDPFKLKGMEIAVERIKKALNNQERVMVFGDYDVDGMTATAIIFTILQDLGAQVTYRLPHRVEDGYGLNKKFIQEAGEIGISLLITVDCGISCASEVTMATSLGIDTIITDHHQIPPNTPEALAIIHPQQPDCEYPYKDLAGAGVALKLVQALIGTFYESGPEYDRQMARYIDLAMLGTIADCMPLTGENRLIAARGLAQLDRTTWPGLQALKRSAKVKGGADAQAVGFQLAPRMNAAGRVDSPYFGLQMLLSPADKAPLFAQKLEEINQRRREMTAAITREAEQQIQSQLNRELLLVAKSSDWHAGVVGLVASKLHERHQRPVAVLNRHGDKYTGSCRGPEGFDWAAALGAHSDVLLKFGGHEQAAGFTVSSENAGKFIKQIQGYVRKSGWQPGSATKLEIDTELTLEDINWDNYATIRQLAPFGLGNNEPIFCLRNLELSNWRFVGSDKQHLQIEITLAGGKPLKGIGFNMAEYRDLLQRKGRLDLAFVLDKNHFRGNDSLQLRLIDLRKT